MTTVALFALAGCDAPAPAPGAPPQVAPTGTDLAPPAGDVLTANGYGPLRVGMSRAEVIAALGADTRPPVEGDAEPPACEVFHPARAPEGLKVMVENGRLSRVTLTGSAAVKTAEGLGLGSTAAQVKAAHADAVVEPHKYEAGAETITVWNGGRPADAYVQDPAARGVRYETDATGVVTLIHVGGPSIQLVESCG